MSDVQTFQANIGYRICGLFAALAVIVLTGCSASGPIQPERLTQIKRVGVVTLLPATLAYDKVGVTVFNNENASRPVGDVFNAAAWRGAEKVLKEHGREVVRVSVDIPQLSKKIRSGAIIFDSPAERIEEELLVLTKEHRLDAIILIAQEFDAENGIDGVRMFFRAGFSSIRDAWLMPSIMVIPVDEKTKSLASACCVSPRLAVQRPGGGEWRYKLADNMDPATHAYLSHMAELSIEGDVARNVRAMGF